MSSGSPGTRASAAPASSAPKPPPMVNSGASVPPEVPLPRAMAQEMNFIVARKSSALPVIVPPKMPSMLS